MTISRVPATPFYPSTPPVAARPAAQQPVAATVGRADATSPSPLWSVLTDEERAFFLSTAALGSLGYGPNGSVKRDMDGPIGQRLDVRA